jgi:hypothetical protein
MSHTIHFSVTPATYYVDNSCSVNGDGLTQTCADSPGGAGPFNSIANMQAKPGGYTAGDKILLKRGLTFTDSRLTISWSGTEGNVITLSAYGEGTNPLLNPDLDYPLYLSENSFVTIDGIDVLTTVEDSAAIRQRGTQDHITFQNLTVQGEKYAHFNQANTTNQTVTNCRFITSGIDNTYGMYFYGTTNSSITVSNSTFTTTAAADLYAIYFVGKANKNITIADIEINHAIMRFNNIENLSISNIVATESGNSNMGLIGILNSGGKLSITDVDSTNALGYGLTISDSSYAAGNATVTGFKHSSSSNVSGHGINVSNSSYIDISDFYVKGMTNGVLILNGSHHITLTDGIAEYNHGDGMDTADTAHDVTFTRCIARNNGTKTEPAPQSSGDGFSAHETNYNINFYYCQAYNNTNAALALWGQSAGLVYNFIGYNNGGDWTADGGSPSDRGGLAVHSSTANPVNGETYIVKNSIFMKNYPVELNTTEYWIGATTSNNNVYYPTNANDFYNIDGDTSTHYSWDQYHTTNGYESNSLNADPLFIAAGTDFHLKDASPAINAGVDVGMHTDFEGNPVPQGSAPDIGAYEFLLPSAAATSTGDVTMAELTAIPTNSPTSTFIPSTNSSSSSVIFLVIITVLLVALIVMTVLFLKVRTK